MSHGYPLYTSPEVGDFDYFDYYCKYCNELLRNGDHFDGEYNEGYDLYHVDCYERYHNAQQRGFKVTTSRD